MSDTMVTEFTYTYPAGKLPARYGKPLTVKVAVDAYGRDRIALYGTQKELDRIYEMVTQARLTAASPQAPQ